VEGISDIKITSIDELRPPLIRKEPYIDLVFKLSHQAPKLWCEDFNRIAAKKKSPAKIDSAIGLYVETYVRKPEEIEAALEFLKEAVKICTQEYIERIIAANSAAAAASGNTPSDEGEQGRLNKIIAALNYDD
jgi:hypothetical protein